MTGENFQLYAWYFSTYIHKAGSGYCNILPYIIFEKKNDTMAEPVAEDPTKLEMNRTGEQYSDSQPVIDSGKSMQNLRLFS